jgi:hypothetical protein
VTAWTTVFATGHRRVAPAGERWLRDNLTHCARWLRDNRQTRVGVSGLALGTDTWWAQSVLAAGQELWAYIPFEEQADTWPKQQRADWAALRAAATRVVVVGEIPADTAAADRKHVVNRLLWARNDAMLDVADACVGVWEPDRRRGGSHGCLRKAARRGMPGIHLDPAVCGVRHRLPTLEELGPAERY